MAKKGRRTVPQKKTRKRGKKRRATAARRNASRDVMNRPVGLSKELAAVVGAPALSRPEAVKRLWAYCREKNLLNPRDKRQILCNGQLQKLLGQKTATMFGLQGLLAPHFDFSAGVGKAKELEEDSGPDAGEDEEEEEEDEISNEEQGVSPDFELDAVARGMKLRVVHLEREAATLNFTVLTRQCHFEAVAIPGGEAGAVAAIRAKCNLNACQGTNGDVETCGEAHVKGLDPAVNYRLAIEIRSLDSSKSVPTFCSAEVMVPQRAWPKRWSPREAQLWCQAIQVPDLAQKVKEYGVDGTTLLSFTEEDLRGVGISVPFVLRRVLSALKGLGGG
mmetsp:Transcript_48372/g.87488  ORF Transcript_48372/g.87488 Transcript_48372/m.87488 type:complete len:333 (-) Transcript_48372:150-1148(-)